MVRGAFGLDIDTDTADELLAAVETPGRVIDRILLDEGAPKIAEEIIPLIPRSGRTWKGKKAAAASTNPFRYLGGSLSVTVKSKKAYNYLYFPDDGSNTDKHAGNLDFMGRGLNSAAPDVAQLCVDALIDAANKK